MKKYISIISVILALIFVLCACGSSVTPTNTPESTEPTTAQTAAPTEQPTEAPTAAPTEEPTAEPTAAPTEEPTTEQTTTEEPHIEEPKTDIKILAIGNSFSVDAMEYLFPILKDGGYENIVLGNLYIGGCSLDQHWSNIVNESKLYTYYLNTEGTWKTYGSMSVEDVIKTEEWDYVTIQQVSQNSGMPSTFGNLNNIVDYVASTVPSAKIYWHMTWAYQSDSTHSGFINYSQNQNKMYEAIVSTVKDTVLSNPNIAGAIPCGTTIQNLRTSYLGDKLTRDGYHLSEDVGRYAAAMTWAAVLGGVDVATVKYTNSTPSLIALPAIVEAVKGAQSEPFAVTPSTVTEKPALEIKTEELDDSDKAILKAAGKDPDKYVRIDLSEGVTVGAFYQSTAKYGLTINANSYYIATRYFTKDDLPIGSVIYIGSGYQYRPEGWQRENSTNTLPRPGNVTTKTVNVDANWWKGYNIRGFNFSNATTSSPTNGKSVTFDEFNQNFRIYIPKK